MKNDWRIDRFDNVMTTITPPAKIKTSAFLPTGNYPIVSQEMDLISGYWNNSEDVVKVSTPIVTFGDHTKTTKYIDFDFVQGADGLKIILFNRFICPKYGYYGILNLDLKNLGYARHFKLLKEAIFAYPVDISEQERLVGILDAAFEKIDAVKRNAERNLQNAKELFQQSLSEAMEPKEGWKTCSLYDIGMIKTGKTPPTSHREFFGNDVPFVTPADISTFAPIAYRTEGLSHAGVRYSSLIPAGATLMVCIGASIGKVANSEKQVTMNQQINAIIPSNEYFSKFITYALCTQRFQRQVKNNAGQTTLPIISKSKWSKLIITLPPNKNEQKDIATNLDCFVQKNQIIQERYNKISANCDELKKAILTQAFNGEL